MEDTDFDLLCVGLSADEAKRIRKILAEWNDGDENGFPVQLAMLTRAQWRAAALIPHAIKDSGKMIELHLAECRHQTAAVVKNLSTVAGNNAVELKNIINAHTETVQQASVAMRNQLWESEEVSRRIKTRLEGSMGEWNKARDDFAAEREKLEKERKELSRRVQRRDTLYAGFILLGAIGFGALLEYFIRH